MAGKVFLTMMRENKIENNPKLKKMAIIALFGVPILLGIFFEIRLYFFNSEITDNKSLTKGVITQVKYGRNSLIYWSYKVNGINYAKYAAETRQFDFLKYCPDYSCLGDTVEVEYSIKSPEKSRLIFHGMRSYR